MIYADTDVVCMECREAIEEIFKDDEGRVFCKGCWTEALLRVEERRDKERSCFSNKSISSQTHLCVNNQGFVVKVQANLLNEKGDLKRIEEVDFNVTVEKNGEYTGVKDLLIENVIEVASIFFYQNEHYIYRLRVPFKRDADGNFANLGDEQDFVAEILTSEEFQKRRLLGR